MFTIIVGGGKMGEYLAVLLLAGNHQVKLIELQQNQVEHLRQVLPAEIVIKGSGSDPNVLEQVGVRQAQVVAAVTGSDETNLVIANLARYEFSVPRTIARVNNPRNAWLYTPEMGVDVGLNQADLMAHLIAEEMSLGDMMTLLKLHKGRFSLVEEKVDPAALAVGKSVQELNLPKQCVLAAIIRKGELIIPHGATVLQPLDELLAVVHQSQVNELARLLGKQN
jgi:trk/ktr system potassium uptake protein